MSLSEKMKYCVNCGAQVNENQEVCLQCGKVLVSKHKSAGANDDGGFKWGLLGFCIPIAGLILFFIWKDEKPLNAKAAGLGALISTILGVISVVLQVIALGNLM